MCLTNKQVIQQESMKVSEELKRDEPLYRAPVQISDVSEGSEEAKRQAEQLSQLQFQTGLSTVHASAAAPGEPVQQMAPARKTYKTRRAEKRRVREEEKRHAAEAREQCPVGDIVTYDIKHQLEDYHTRQKALFASYFPFTGYDENGNPKYDMSKNRSGVDKRMLQIFSHAFRTNEAVVSADEEYQREGEAFYDAFCSTDYERRVPYLQQMVEDVLNFNLKKDMFSDKNLRSNAAALKSMADRIVYMENVMKDKNNAFFFDTPLCPVKKEALKKALDIAAPMASLFKAECQKRGVEPDDREVPYISEKAVIDKYSRQAEFFAGLYKGKPEEYQSLKKSLKQEGANQQSPEIYQQPSGIYHQVRSALENDVKKILDCNVENLSALSDEDLQKRREELDKLYAASLKVERCLPIKRPDQFNPRSKLTLREDLIGQRKLEYEYKSALLRGLAERAAGFKKQGERTMEAASALYQKRMTPGTEECQKFFEYFGKEHNLQELIINAPTFDDVAKEFYAGTGELAEAEKRLRQNHYFSLDEEERIRLDMPKTIGEPLFRSLGSFLHLEATHTRLTPEQFKQMLLNLGAGAGLTPVSSEEERKPAIEKNNAGLDTLRDVMAAQYEMLERKYGNSIEQLTIKDVMEHFVDIAKDFANIQVDLHMTKRFPGFIRENNPDDERLDNRIRYYNTCAFHVFDIVSFIGSGLITAEEVSDEMFKVKFGEIFKDFEDPQKRDKIEELEKIKERLKRDKIEQPRTLEEMEMFTQLIELDRFRDLEKLRDAREALMRDNSFQHPLDWSQKVREPITDDIKHQMEDYYQQHANSRKSYFKSHTNQSGVDPRMVDAYTHGFRTDETGKPATADDEKYQREDEELYDAFCSTDYERRRPYLQRIVEEVLSFDLEKDMFSDNSLQNNAAGLKDIAQRLVLLDNQINDENNRFFFRELSPVKWNALGQALEMAPLFGTSLGTVCGTKGVMESTCSYGEQEDIDIYSSQVEMIVSEYQEKVGAYRSMRDMLKSAVAIEERVGRIGTVDPERLPAAEFYQHVRSLLKPEVQKLLDLNVEELQTMSNGDILELYNASLDVDKCLTHKHPDQPERTMKDELIGERGSEYEHKLTVLRELAEKAADRKNEAGGSHGGKF
ncbi:MAG: hypothetical protein HDR02_02550 [Lachnospiraceae bacterium]|nr:hypothetical protein [Lachnospiraceae bacterium]